jgi:hypothetical protein
MPHSSTFATAFRGQCAVCAVGCKRPSASGSAQRRLAVTTVRDFLGR